MAFYLELKDKGGKHFRRYTAEGLKTLFDVVPTAANFELMLLVESLVFLIYRTYCIFNDKGEEYKKFILNERANSFYGAVKRIRDLKLVDNDLASKLDEYRKQRNKVTHDLFRMKVVGVEIEGQTPFVDYSYNEELERLFKAGMAVLEPLSELVIPNNRPDSKYIKTYFPKGIPQKFLKNFSIPLKD